MKSLFSWLTTLCFATFLAGCGGGGGSADDPGAGPAAGSGAPALSLTGQVLAADTQSPLKAVRLSANGASTTTDAEGRFRLDLDVAARIVLYAEADGYAERIEVLEVGTAGPAATTLRMLPAAPAVTVDPTQASTVDAPNSSAQVRLPGNALVVAATGQAPSGPVRVGVTPIAPAEDPAQMPGGYRTEVAGAPRSIESFGAIKVDLRDTAGQRLDLAPGARSTIRIPLSTRSPNPPASVPLFYLDEKTGLWVQEGSATLAGHGAGRFYEGEVGHFTYWNADQLTRTITVTGCVVDTAGNRLDGYRVISDGIDYSGSADAATDAQGRFSVSMRSASKASIYAERGAVVSSVAVAQSADAALTLPACLVVPAIGTPVPPVIVSPPQDTFVEVGLPPTFTVTAIGTGPLSYAWHCDGLRVPVDATGRVLQLPPTTAAEDQKVCWVVVSNAAGSATSERARLTVGREPVAPGFVLQPQDRAVLRGSPVSFAVVASGSAPFSYQWMRNGAPIAGATQADYTIGATLASDDGARFSVQVTNAGGTVGSVEAVLRVAEASGTPTLTSQPAQQAVRDGDDATFAVVALATAPLSYQWQRNGVAIPGATASSYTLTAGAGDDGAAFRVVVSAGGASVTSASALLVVLGGDDDAQQRLLALANLWTTVQRASAGGMALVGPALTLANPLCPTGTAALTVDGAAIAAGQTLPSGTHTLAAVLSGCEDMAGVLVSGSVSAAYDYSGPEQQFGGYAATMTGLRLEEPAGSGSESDNRVDGSATTRFVVQRGSALQTVDTTFTPAAGTTLLNALSQVRTTFDGGSVVTRTVTENPDAPSERLRSLGVQFNALRLTIGGVDYRLDGAYEIGFPVGGQALEGSGSVTVSAGGSTIGRLIATPRGLVADVRGLVPALRVQIPGAQRLGDGPLSLAARR